MLLELALICAGNYARQSGIYRRRWVAARKEMKNLAVLFRGAPFLINTCHTLCQPDGATASQPYAAKFVDFVTSAEGQALVRNYGADLYREGIHNDAAYARKCDH